MGSAIESVVNANIEKFGTTIFLLSNEADVKYAHLFKRGVLSGDAVGLFFLRNTEAILDLHAYYSAGFKKVVIYDIPIVNECLKAYAQLGGYNDSNVEYVDLGSNLSTTLKFDKIIMNPPYDGSLHLKILSAVIAEEPDAEIVNLSPIRWLQDPFAATKKTSDFNRFENIRKHLSSVEVFTSSQAQNVFGNVMGMDLGVYMLDKNGGFDCEKLISQICRKIINQGGIFDHFDYNMKDGWRVKITQVGGGGFGHGACVLRSQKLIAFHDGKKDGKWWYDFYQRNQHSKITEEITCSLGFNSEKEANNFIDVMSKSKLGRYYYHKSVVDVHVHHYNFIKLDYTRPWTDQELYEYFHLTEDEIALVEKEIQ